MGMSQTLRIRSRTSSTIAVRSSVKWRTSSRKNQSSRKAVWWNAGRTMTSISWNRQRTDISFFLGNMLILRWRRRQVLTSSNLWKLSPNWLTKEIRTTTNYASSKGWFVTWSRTTSLCHWSKRQRKSWKIFQTGYFSTRCVTTACTAAHAWKPLCMIFLTNSNASWKRA